MYPPFRPKKRWLQYWIFRFKHGFFPCDCWNLDHELALWLLPRLKYFKKSTCAHPFSLDDGKTEATEEDWQAVLTEMIDGFELKIKEWEPEVTENYQESQKKITRAFTLLGQYGQSLWD